MAEDNEPKINLADPHVELTLAKLLGLVEKRKIPTLDEDDIIVLKLVASTIRSIKAGISFFSHFGVPLKASMYIAGAYLLIKDKGLFDTLKDFTRGFFK